MKYWIFQNNQVLGPYLPDDMARVAAFSSESLVCPEGRPGTSMGDWQRAGMIADLAPALLRASSANAPAALEIATLPPEPTFKDLAVLGTLQEKVAKLEDLSQQQQERLRVKDAELNLVQKDLALKSREANEIRGEAARLQRESEQLKRQLAGLEERLSSVRLLSETLDKALEEESRVEQDVEKQGQTLNELAKELENLRRQFEEQQSRAKAEPVAPPEPVSDIPAQPVSLNPIESSASFSAPVSEQSEAAAEIFIEPAPNEIVPQSAPEAPLDVPAQAQIESLKSADMPSAPPAIEEIRAAAPSEDATKPEQPLDFVSLDQQDPVILHGNQQASTDIAEILASDPAVAHDTMTPLPQSLSRGKKIGLFAALIVILSAAIWAVTGGRSGGEAAPDSSENASTEAVPAPATVAEAPAVDGRQEAVHLAKDWILPGGAKLAAALEDLAPASGNLSPWMAEPLSGARYQVNYFTRAAAPGAPTIAYEFEVDLDNKSVAGRNVAAKSVLSGKALPPPVPPKKKPVRVKIKRKTQPTSPSADAPEASSTEETPSPALKTRANDSMQKPADATLLDDLLKE